MNEIQRQMKELVSILEVEYQGQHIKSMTANFIEDYCYDS
jgi:hypothetical protein